MSVQIIERRYCDVCEQEYSDRPDWMILSAPNAPEGVDASWDFCSYSCLQSWILEDDVDDAGPDVGVQHDVALAMGQVEKRAPFHVEQPDGTPPPPAEVRRVHDGESTREGATTSDAITMAEAQAKLDAAMAEMRKQEDDRPPMTLMEAIASGKLPFDRGPQ